jgi:CHAT domain-containing protein
VGATAGGSRRLTVRLHEESTPITWLRDVALRDTTRDRLLTELSVLDGWATGRGTDRDQVRRAAHRLGRDLFDAVLGRQGRAYLAQHPPTALMVDADERLLDLPWELLDDGDGPLALRYPFGRLVSTRTRPRPERDPALEDDTVRVLAVVDPTKDLGDASAELDAVRALAAAQALELHVLEEGAATHRALAEHVAATRYDIVHLSCHGGFLPRTPGASGLLLADGPLLTSEILALPWAAPPYLAFASACWSSRSAGARRLSGSGSANGVAAAFLAAGASAAAGFGWPVTVRGAAAFAAAFYEGIVTTRNVGLAVLDARQRLVTELWQDAADLAGPGFMFYGDSGGATRARRDLQTAVPPDEPTDPPRTDPRRDLATAS